MREGRGGRRREGAGQGKAAQDAAAKAALDAFHLCPSLDVLVPALVDGGPGDLQRRCRLTPGAPPHSLELPTAAQRGSCQREGPPGGGGVERLTSGV